MFELNINGQVFNFHFGIGFLREMNKRIQVPVNDAPGVKRSVGFRYAAAEIIDGDVEELIDMLDVANKGQDPRVTKALLESYVDDENTDIDQLFKDVLDFLSSANATRKTMESLNELVEESKKK